MDQPQSEEKREASGDSDEEFRDATMPEDAGDAPSVQGSDEEGDTAVPGAGEQRLFTSISLEIIGLEAEQSRGL